MLFLFLTIKHKNKIDIMIVIRKSKLIIAVLMLIITIGCSIYEPKKDTYIQTSTNGAKYKILVDIEESQLYLFQDNELVKTYKCSGGKWSTPSPIGTWTIISKAKWGEGFGGSWMGLNVPWGQFGIHGTLEQSSIRLGKLTWMHKNEK